MRSRRARALHTCLAPRNNAQHYIFLNRAGTSGRAPSRSRRQKARPSAGKQHHQNLCLTTPSSPPSTSVGRAPDSACTRSSSHLHPDAWVCRPSGNFSRTAVWKNLAWFENYLITTTTTAAMRPPLGPRSSRRPDRTSRWAPQPTTSRTRSRRWPWPSIWWPFRRRS